jgi:hypothetical protein
MTECRQPPVYFWLQGKAFKVDSAEIASLFNFEFDLSPPDESSSADEVTIDDEIEPENETNHNYARKMNNKVDF